jgi:hypothetical protein
MEKLSKAQAQYQDSRDIRCSGLLLRKLINCPLFRPQFPDLIGCVARRH